MGWRRKIGEVLILWYGSLCSVLLEQDEANFNVKALKKNVFDYRFANSRIPACIWKEERSGTSSMWFSANHRTSTRTHRIRILSGAKEQTAFFFCLFHSLHFSFDQELAPDAWLLKIAHNGGFSK